MHDPNHPEFESPVDLSGRALPDGNPLRWMTLTIFTAAIALALVNATAFTGWVDEMEPGPAQDQLSQAAHQWETITDDIGLSVPRAQLHILWKHLQAVRFGAEVPGEGQG